MSEFVTQRAEMVRTQLAARGLRDATVLAAMGSVPREAFVPEHLQEFTYADTPLPIERGQTISQPYIVALMTAALKLRPTDRVLEVGTGSGYAAAVLGRVAQEVYTIERHGELAELATHRLRDLGFDNVTVRHGDGTLGWPEKAPFDAIVVAAGGPQIPSSLRDQLAVGGRLVIPVGEARSLQRLIRTTRVTEDDYQTDHLDDVRFVPLVGVEGWQDEREEVAPARASSPHTIAGIIREEAEPISEIEECDVSALLDRIGDRRLVLIGEATHGTSEFYRMRARITKGLIQRRGFRFVGVEADWPDAARVNQYVRGEEPPFGPRWEAFARFPTWMWRNQEVLDFVEWLRDYNASTHDDHEKVGFYGLDLYSLFTSIREVVDYLERVDPRAADVARHRYGCLTPWERDPAVYGHAAITGRYRVCAKEAVAMLQDMLRRRAEYSERDGDRFLDATRNAQLVANAERYYRAMYYGGHESWNLRDQHMFETLQSLLQFHGQGAKAVVWEHNSHLGDATATESGAQGQINVGSLVRKAFGEQAYLIGFGTDHGTVAAASSWDSPMQVMDVRPSHEDSYERLCHEARREAFFLPVRNPRRMALRAELLQPRLERAIGVVYRPETELQSHYFHASLPLQFDEYIWFDRTSAVSPISTSKARQLPADHPFAIEGLPR